MASPQQSDPAAAPLPSEWVRTVVTFLIFVHFFFLLISIKSKTTSSGLEQDLRQRAPGLSPYVQYLRLDYNYMFHLTYYDPLQLELAKETPDPQDDRQMLLDFRPMDTEFYVEADLLGPTGAVVKTILWPPADLKPGARRLRFERLVQTAVANIDNANYNPADFIAKGIADRIMAENQVRSVVLRFRRRVLQNLMVPHTSPRFKAEKDRDPDAPENFPLVYKPEPNRTPAVHELRAERSASGEVTLSSAQSGYNSAGASRQTTNAVPPAGTAAPSGSATPAGTIPRTDIKPVTIPLGTAAPAGTVKP